MQCSIAYSLILSIIGLILFLALIAAVYLWWQAEQRLHEYHELFRGNEDANT